MSEKDLQDAYATLKLAMDANLTTIETAYSQQKELFGSNSIACYSLCSEAERHASLKAIESAYQLIISERFVQRTQPEPVSMSERRIEVATPSPGVSPGNFLKQQRQKLDISLATIVDQTKISRTILSYIEQEAYAYLPATVYLRGFITEFAKIVHAADPSQIASQYLEQMRQDSGQTVCQEF
jgi:hypothetical protein